SAAALTELLDLDAGACLFKLRLGTVGFAPRDRFADRLRSRVDEILRLLEAEPGDLTNGLDHVDLGVAGMGEDDRELGLLLARGVGCGRRGGGGGDRGGGLD